MTKVKMRDIPFSEVKDHFLNCPSNAEKLWETCLRNRYVSLTGQIEEYSHLNVTGYETNISFDDEGTFWACEICAEIGD